MSNSINTIITQLNNLDKEFESAKKKNNKNKMFKILYYIRVFHGDILLHINNFTNIPSNNNDIKKKYRLSLLKSLLDLVEYSIKNAENILRESNQDSKLQNIANYIDNSTDQVLSDKNQKNIDDDIISIDDIKTSINFDSDISESQTEQPTEQLLTNKDNSELYNQPFGIKGSDNLLVLFYAPWCGWSKKFLPIWDEFVEKMKDIDNIKCIKINSDEKPDCIEHFNIQGFPTIKLLRKNNDTVEFKEHRSLDNLIKWTKKIIK
jgi:thiol-disulfide isomerase/thioredoxin